MKKNKYLFVFFMLLAITMAGGIFTRAYISLEHGQEGEHRLHVVTSFYPVYIAARNVVGDNPEVILENLSEPQTGCMHDYQLTPQDMILLSGADLFLVNGGGIESFLSEVGKAYPELRICQTTEGMELLTEESGHDHTGEAHSHEEDGHVHTGENAHAWMDTRLYAQMVQNIAAALGNADPEHAKEYQKHANSYCGKIQELTDQLSELSERAAGRPVVIFHEAYAYVAEELEMETMYCLNLDEERQVSAREVADVMEEISEHNISLVLAEELYGKDMGNTVETETSGKVYYLDTLVRGSYEDDSYLKAMQKNIDVLREALEE